MYIAVRADLAPGLQIAQAVHAAFQFQHLHPEITADWYADSNYLVVVAVPDQAALVRLSERAALKDLEMVLVREPDLDDAATALALGPGDTARRLCSNLPLALREPVPT